MNPDRTLRWTASALSIWSFTAIVVTGQLLWVGAAIVYAFHAAVLLRGDWLRRIGDGVWRVINILVFLAALAYSYSDYGNTLVYGTVYLQIQKLIRDKGPRDHLWLFLLSMFQVVLSAAISDSLGFMVTLAGFIGLVVFALVLLTLTRGRMEVEARAARAPGVGQPLAGFEAQDGAVAAKQATAQGAIALFTAGYILRIAAVCAAAFLVSTVFFITIPRFAVRKDFMRLRPFEVPTVTGFSEQVEIGRISEIYHNRTLVMRVWPPRQEARSPAPKVLRMRGVALETFNGSRWYSEAEFRKRARTISVRDSHETFPVPFAYDWNHSVRLMIAQDLRQTKWLFGPPFIGEMREFDQSIEMRYHPDSHAFEVTGSSREHLRYRLLTYLQPPLTAVPEPRTSAKRSAARAKLDHEAIPEEPWVMPENFRMKYTFLPRNLPQMDRIRALAEEQTLGTSTPLGQVTRLRDFFHTSFRYSLKSEETTPSAFLTHFLFVGRQGHCETFATAMAVLCRSIGIPARVIKGFYSTEFNRYEKFFAVRQNHAHTWVEVWLDGFGWLTVDPTPPDALDSGSDRFAFLTVLSDYWDAWTVRWRRYVVDFSLAVGQAAKHSIDEARRAV
jgi:transglutaminase-like putative cysteine protease